MSFRCCMTYDMGCIPFQGWEGYWRQPRGKVVFLSLKISLISKKNELTLWRKKHFKKIYCQNFMSIYIYIYMWYGMSCSIHKSMKNCQRQRRWLRWKNGSWWNIQFLQANWETLLTIGFQGPATTGPPVLLIQSGCDVNQKTRFGEPPLAPACEFGELAQCMQRDNNITMISVSMQFAVYSQFSWTPLQSAAIIPEPRSCYLRKGLVLEGCEKIGPDLVQLTWSQCNYG